MYEGMKAPDKNKNGLVIPPTPIELSPEQANQKGRKSFPDRHHVYFPRVAFLKSGNLAYRFREHQFNSIFLPRFQHERLHRRYDPLVRDYPDFFIPNEDVMATFLDEAELLEDLGVNVRAVDMINDAIYEDRVRRLDRTLENREERLEKVSQQMSRLCELTVVPRYIKRPFAEMGRTCLGSAA